MDALVNLSWRLYPASALMALGAALALWGLLLEWRGIYLALRRDSSKILDYLQGFRLSIIGLALVGIGAAWTWHITALLVLALVIGGPEVLESSTYIYAIRRGQRQARKQAA